MKAMILCAGLGTRLRPLTERWPKPALPLLGQPLFRYHLAVLRAAGVRSICINTHHLPDAMREVAEAECARAQLPLEVVHEAEIQGTGGGIRGLRAALQGDDFIVFNGDILFPVDLKPVLAAHRASRAAATMVLMPLPSTERYSAVEVDAQSRVKRIAGLGPEERGLRPLHFTGVHVMSPAVFDFMSKTGVEDINRDVYVRMIAAGQTIRGEEVQGYWSDLGTPSRYLATQQDVLSGRASLASLGADSPLKQVPRGAGNFWAHPSARVWAEQVEGPAYFSAQAQLAPSAHVGQGVWLAENSKGGEGSQFSRVSVFPDTEVAAGEVLQDVLAWGRYRIPAAP